MKILGTDYSFVRRNIEGDGEVNFYTKEICIRPKAEMFQGDGTDFEKRMRSEETILHELIHSFFWEYGQEEYAYDENLVTVLTRMIPKIFEVLPDAYAESIGKEIFGV